MRKYFFIIGLFVVLLSACRSTRQVVQQTSSDSTSVTFKEVEKIVQIPGDTVSVKMQALISSVNSALNDVPISDRGAIEASSPLFVPQVQTIETKRTKVRIELTKSGEIKATAISKELDEKITLLQREITKSKTSLIVEQKEAENWFKEAKRKIKTLLIAMAVVLIIAVYASLKWGFDPISIIKKLLNK